MDMIKNKEIVVPGQVLAKGMDFIPSSWTFRDGEDIVASRVGLAQVKGRVIQVVPLAGSYLPEYGDLVIGKVVDVNHSGWEIDIGLPVNPFITVGDAVPRYKQRIENFDHSKLISLGDIIRAPIMKATKYDIKLCADDRSFGRLSNGIIVKISPVKVPRVIGKKGSMITLLKDKTGCRIFVGKNGWIWVAGDAEKQVLTQKAIELIEKEAHKSGLTEKVQRFLGVPEEEIERTKKEAELAKEENGTDIEVTANDISVEETVKEEKKPKEEKPKAKKAKKGDKK